MPFTLTMPKLSPTMTSGTVAKWHKKPGDRVENGDLLLEISTDKATIEHTALDEGWMRQILVQEGEDAMVNQPIAVLSESKEENIEGYVPEGVEGSEPGPQATEEEESEPVPVETKKPAKAAAKATGTSTMAQPQFIPAPPLESWEFRPPRGEVSERLAASPLARKLAKDKGVSLSSVKGTGPGHRIMSRDLEQAQRATEVGFGQREAPKTAPGTYEEAALSPMRRVIARRLQESKTFIPHFYVRQTVNAQALVSARDQLHNAGIKVTYNDFIVRASALALRAVPGVNSGFNSASNVIINFKTIDISVAVSVPDGLITPIVRHADYKNLGEISQEVRALVARARDGQLQAEEYQGGSFTVSNLGMYGIDDFIAVINPPQAAILAVGSIRDVPVVVNGSVVPGKELGLILSSDHRVVDGALAAHFMSKLRHYLENPALLLI